VFLIFRPAYLFNINSFIFQNKKGTLWGATVMHRQAYWECTIFAAIFFNSIEKRGKLIKGVEKSRKK